MTKAELFEEIRNLIDKTERHDRLKVNVADVPEEAYACISFGQGSDGEIAGVLPGDIVFGWNGEEPTCRVPLKGILEATFDNESTAIDNSSIEDLYRLRDLFTWLGEFFELEAKQRELDGDDWERSLEEQKALARKLIEMAGTELKDA